MTPLSPSSCLSLTFLIYRLLLLGFGMLVFLSLHFSSPVLDLCRPVVFLPAAAWFYFSSFFRPVLFLASISLIFLSELCSSFSDSSPNFLLQTFQFVSPAGDVFSPYSILFSLYILTFSHYFLLCPMVFSPCCPSYMIHFPSANKQMINQNLIRMT